MAVAREIASEAGDTLVERFHQVKKVTSKGRGNIVTDVDTEVEEKMLEAIRREFPDMGFLGEESKGASPDSGYVWIVLVFVVMLILFYTGLIRPLASYLYSPFAFVLIVVMCLEFLFLKSRDPVI